MAEAHPLMLYNTLTRRKEAFEPLDPGNVRMYVCGPTVYDYAHIGNARPVIVFDVLFRLLRHIYGAKHVTYVRNITDVDDKINARAAQEYPDLPLNEAIRKVTTATEKQFHDDIRALGVLTREDVNRPGEPPVFFEPRATEHIDGMKQLIEMLVRNGHAYVAEDHVLFDVPSMPDYGRLSNRTLEEMEAGARVEVAPYKKDPMDFVLWKPSKAGEPSWPSPCGIGAPGRPGWHIECSAMAERHLGPVFDIHGGGIDLVFPHHENEIAQSRCAHGTPVMARYWLHNGFLQVEGEKMSKSLGNFVTIHELLAGTEFGERAWAGDVIRLAMLKTHYRQPLDWTAHSLFEARRDLRKWTRATGNTVLDEDDRSVDGELLNALNDDLNTPAAIARVHKLSGDVEEGLANPSVLSRALSFLGIRHYSRHGFFTDASAFVPPEFQETYESLIPEIHLFHAAEANNDSSTADQSRKRLKSNGISVSVRNDGWLQIEIDGGVDEDRIGSLVEARNAARKAKDFKEADRIRDELAAMGIALKDSKDPKTGEITTTWEVRAPSTTESVR